MKRGAGIALGVTVAFLSGLAVAACGPGESEETDASPAPVAQTTQATLPVVTVYKAPT